MRGPLKKGVTPNLGGFAFRGLRKMPQRVFPWYHQNGFGRPRPGSALVCTCCAVVLSEKQTRENQTRIKQIQDYVSRPDCGGGGVILFGIVFSAYFCMFEEKYEAPRENYRSKRKTMSAALTWRVCLSSGMYVPVSSPFARAFVFKWTRGVHVQAS